MKSLFLRLLISMWLAMALLVGAFAAIHAWAVPPEAGELRQKYTARMAQTRGENALFCMNQGLAECERSLVRRDARDQRLALYRDGAVALGEPLASGAELATLALAAPERTVFRPGEDAELTAVVLDRDPRYVVVAEGPVWSRWRFFIASETLPYRLLAIVLVTGLVAVVLARYLSRPIARLRRATQQMAAGDLSVRVGELGPADSETRALGRDLDAMAERIQSLLDSERRLRRDVSHELRSPLARLNISLELIRRKSAPELEPAFARIERDTARLDAMIGELLAINRLEAEGIRGGDLVELGALAQQIVDDVSLEAEQRRASVRASLGVDCTVRGNRELLRRALENVLRNAVRFTAEGTSVEVELTRDGERAQVRVRDHGPGVPSEALGQLFKPFYRVEGDRARNTGGTGLGLAITEQAVLVHGGRVRADNHRQGGLVVTIELPVASAEVTAGDPSRRAEVGPLGAVRPA